MLLKLILFGIIITHSARAELVFSGGPEGGMFGYFATGIAEHLTAETGCKISSKISSGSVENLRQVHEGNADFGIVYSGDLYLGLHGKLVNDEQKYFNVQAMAYLYGAAAQLVVLADAEIETIIDLFGKTVAIGPKGSGAAASAQRFFHSINSWDKIIPKYIGYNAGVEKLLARQIDALWVFAGYPNEAVTRAATQAKINLLQLYDVASDGNLFTQHPYYFKIKIPAGTYANVDYDVNSIEDAAVWVASNHLDTNKIYKFLTIIYDKKGLDFMHNITPAAKSMSLESGLDGIVTILHPGAGKFWSENNHALTVFMLCN
jgi:uncharacterized protein